MKSFRCLAFAVTCFIALAAAGASQHVPRLDAQAEYDKGLTAQKTGHTLAAIQAFQKAVELDPDYTEAFSALLAAARAAQRGNQEVPTQEAMVADSALLLIRVIYEWRATASPDKAVYQWALTCSAPLNSRSRPCWRISQSNIFPRN